MTAIRPNLLKLLAPLAVFGCLLAVLSVLNRSHAPATPLADLNISLGASTDQQVKGYQRAVRQDPEDAGSYASLGDAYLQKARETADPGFYMRASRAYEAALSRDSRNVQAVIGAGTLANLRHDFRAGLNRALEAHRLDPGLVRPYAVLADSQIELGRYPQAARSIQRMLDLKPGLASYARASYLRELEGDLAGAAAAMRLAVSAGGAPENRAYVQTLLGDIELQRGRLASARSAYRSALAGDPAYPQAEAGLARTLAAGGDLAGAAARLRSVTARLPLTSYLTLLADLDQATGHHARASRDLAVVRAQQQLLRAGGAVPDAELVVFDADHGDARAAVALGRRVWRLAPSVRSADALGWALTRAGRPKAGLEWAHRALHLGSRDPLFRLHAGLAAKAAGRRTEARQQLRLSLRASAALSPLRLRALRTALREVGP